MQLKIYFYDFCLSITDKLSEDGQDWLEIPGHELHQNQIFPPSASLQEQAKLLADFGQRLLKSEKHPEGVPKGILIVAPLAKELTEQLFKHFHLVEAAGGLVVNPNEELLFIQRRGKWDLPKGKIEPGEKRDYSAIREVEEETGVHHLELIKLLCTTYHAYAYPSIAQPEEMVLKPTYWYLMKTPEITKGKPQIEEDITSVKWMNINQLDDVIKNTYPSIQDVLEKFESDNRGYF
jgi:8-oxo-dGTP pyrophosphatase MutT (NUDIX family)